MTITEETAQELNRTMNRFLDAMGMTNNHRLAPIEAEEKAKAIVLQFRKKRGLENDSKAC
jgi:polysaccharide deacetylase 2 family uncharacterized protein YibQ